jgi:hypothetical protein
MVVIHVRISSRRIRLPNLDQAIRHRVAIPIQHSPAHNNAFSQRFSRMLASEVLIMWTNIRMAKDWPSHL